MNFDPENPATWPRFDPLIIAHDVGRSRDRSTAVIGGNSPVRRDLLGISEFHELPLGLFGSARAVELATIDRRFNSNALIVADVSNDASYVEVLYETFGSRVIGVQIGRAGDGTQVERRQVQGGSVLVYNVGRNYLLELLQSRLLADLVKFVPGPASRKAFEQLTALETEMRETGPVYRCPSGHDDLAISCAMLAWAARHPHLDHWVRTVMAGRRPRKPRQSYSWDAFT